MERGILEIRHGQELFEKAKKQKSKPFSCKLLWVSPEDLLVTRTDFKYGKGECLCLGTLGDENVYGRANCGFKWLVWDSEHKSLIGTCKYNSQKVILTPKGWESRV